ncbi:hypothetical protein [Pseudoalteromonas sp. G4]|uniref:hypothetical protein n=1 Tax=Pseudoalteromonas sp. G4 TaxID=2992761 RepID=UPI00237E40BD|nr:hypothetical protein [Pseudoalteromonas sp. G4]MDE3274274.1 hypothetical protein [Pseudoalteromonas sp. G4]
MKYIVLILLMLISAGCSAGLQQREVRECRESAFQNQAIPMAVMEAQYKDCLNNKKEIREAERQIALTENVLEILLAIFGAKELD